MSETDLIRRLEQTLGASDRTVLVGIGDDAAVLAPDLVVTSDLVVEDVHFRRATTPLADLGWKALAVNVSDLAAMGATPIGAVVGLALGPDWDADAATEIYRGLAACADTYRCPIVGGDISRGRDLVLAVTAFGRASAPALRSGAVAGDVIAVTGALGGSEAGRRLLEGLVCDAAPAAALHERHRRPQARLADGLLLAPLVHAMLDVSDGVATDARRIAAASRVVVEIDLDRLPLQAGVAAVAEAIGLEPGVFAATGGEDYELLVAIAPGDLARAPVALTAIGQVSEGPAALRFIGAGASSALAGWDHLGR